MPVPPAVPDFISVLYVDQDATVQAKADKATTATALATAQHADDSQAATVASAQSKLAADLAAAHAMLDSTFADAPVAPPVQPV